MPPGHSDGSAKGQGIGVGLGLGVGEGEGDGEGEVPQAVISITWQEKGSTSNGGMKHRKSLKSMSKQEAAGVLQSAGPTLFCGGQLTHVLSRDRVSMLQSGGSQQLWSSDELEVLVSTSYAPKKFTGTILAGKLTASNLENGEPGGPSFHPNASVRGEG